jgi:hypothetical protein
MQGSAPLTGAGARGRLISMLQRLQRHAAPIALLGIAVGLWLSPVLSRLHEVVPGTGPGDNLTFVWNLWWMRVAVRDAHYSFLQCPLIFYPFGVNLALHTHTALPAFVAAVLAPHASLLATQNVSIALNLFLNCAVAYALAYSIVRHVGGAMVAAIVFGWSPYVSAHLMGHFNLVAAWVLPLITLLALRAFDGNRAARWFLGGSLAVAVYMDYYYAVYGVLLVVLIASTPACSCALDERPRPFRWQRAVAVALISVLAIDVLAIALILATGGMVIRLGPTTVSVLSVRNPASAGWLVLGLLAAVWWIPRIHLTLDFTRLGRHVRAALIPAAVLIVAAMPLLLSTFQLWRAGDYVSQRYYWRSAPRGIDVATLLLGNPYGVLMGKSTIAAYQRLGIDPIEQVGWIGPGVLVLGVIGALRQRHRAETKAVLLFTLFFVVWSLGPFLMAFARNTALILPATLVRFLPLVSNARMPGRAFVVVYMGAAVLSGLGFAWLARSTNPRYRTAALALGALVAADYLPAAPLAYAPGHPAPYDVIEHGGPAGAVLELPLGLRDGLGETGHLDTRVLYYQSFHERPILGGFVARLAPSVLARYRELPVVGALLQLSGGASLADVSPEADRKRARPALAELGVRYVVVDLQTASPDLIAYVQAVLPLRLVARDQERAIYELTR